jgi:hypothetical protein
MTKKVKLFIVDEKPYLGSLDKIEVGDKAIVTVGGKYPSIVECNTEQILNLITDSRLTLTQGYKLYLSPEKIELSKDQIDVILETDGIIEITEENGTIFYNV